MWPAILLLSPLALAAGLYLQRQLEPNLRVGLTVEGEVIVKADPDVGYLHRSIEKIGEKMTWHGFVPYTDRADYLAANLHLRFWGARHRSCITDRVFVTGRI